MIRIMKIATYNINGIKARLPRLKEWLEETRPAIAFTDHIVAIGLLREVKFVLKSRTPAAFDRQPQNRGLFLLLCDQSDSLSSGRG